jgi:hypothetical protein
MQARTPELSRAGLLGADVYGGDEGRETPRRPGLTDA